MGLLDDQLLADVSAFIDVDGSFAESINYTPSGAIAKTVMAQVYRSVPETINGTIVNNVEIEIANDSTLGVATVTRFADIVNIPAREGQPEVTLKVVAVVQQDPGMWRLRLK